MLTLDQVLDDADIEQDTGFVLRTHVLGDLQLPTGRIVARDPLSGAPAPAFNMIVPPGSYRSSLRFLADPNPVHSFKFHDIVALVVRFRSGSAASWALALTPDDPPPEDIDFERTYGFMVDSATAGVLDAQIQDFLDMKVVRDRLWKSRETPPGGAIVEAGQANVALGITGGDGIKPAYFAFDENDRAVALVVDFKMTAIQPVADAI